MAACAVILSINIDRLEECQLSFFKDAKKGELLQLNLDIWGSEDVEQTSGYKISDLRECLYDLAVFVSECLSPNPLEMFDIEAIKPRA